MPFGTHFALNFGILLSPLSKVRGAALKGLQRLPGQAGAHHALLKLGELLLVLRLAGDHGRELGLWGSSGYVFWLSFAQN